MKKCTRCKIEKELDCFRNDKSKTDGKFHTCKQCMNKYYYDNYKINYPERYIAHNQKRKNKWREIFLSIKSVSKCNRCPESHIATLCFHHKDKKEKDFAISKNGRQISNRI